MLACIIVSAPALAVGTAFALYNLRENLLASRSTKN